MDNVTTDSRVQLKEEVEAQPQKEIADAAKLILPNHVNTMDFVSKALEISSTPNAQTYTPAAVKTPVVVEKPSHASRQKTDQHNHHSRQDSQQKRKKNTRSRYANLD
jgi:hypothetical protein